MKPMKQSDMGPDEESGDNESLMDHCALECMHAIEAKDKSGFVDALHVLMADLLNKMQSEDKED